MYLSRVSLKRGAAADRAFWAALANDALGHHTVWTWFSEGSPEPQARDFLYRQEGQGTETSFLVLSKRLPRAATAVWHVEVKPFEPRLKAGETLEFRVRVNPTVRRARRPGDGADEAGFVGKRVDVYVDARRRRGDEPSPGELLSDVCEEWLTRRAERRGFELCSGHFRADGHRRNRVLRRGGARPALFTTVDLSGVLRVTDPEVFLQTLRTGIGAEKAFGCGLMLVRRSRIPTG